MAAFVLPKLYAKSSKYNLIFTKYILDKYKHLFIWKDDCSILEIGVGDGSNTRESLWPIIPKNYKKFVATDISKKMITFAETQGIVPKTEFRELDIGCENIPSCLVEGFDYVFSFFAMMYVKKPEQAFENIYSMLKPQGQTFQTFVSDLPANPVYLKLSKHPKWGKYKQELMISPYFNRPYPEKCFENAIALGGFTDYYFAVEDTTYSFQTEESWKDWFLSINATVSNIPNDELDDYKNDFFQEIRKQVLIYENNENNEEHWNYNFKTCILFARKE